MNGSGILSKLLSGALENTGNIGYRAANKDLKAAINHRLYEESPDLFHTDYQGALLGEGGGSTIPRIHVDDLKHYFGRTEDIPTKYKRSTGKRDIDELAAMAGHDDIDSFVEAVQSELSARAAQRDSARILSERRNDLDFIRETQKIMDEEKAMYGAPEVFEPSKRDYQWYIKNVVMPQEAAATPKRTGMENFKINRNDISYDVPSITLNYLPNTQRIPVRGQTKPAAAPQPQPKPVQNMLPSNQMIVPQGNQNDRGSVLANILALNMIGE